MTQSTANLKVQASILIIDDEILNRKLFQTLLHLKGYLTYMAANAEEALTALGKNVPDLILLDIMMPDVDGYQLAETIKKKTAWARIPIIMVTALSGHDARLTGMMAGADDVLTKPIDRSELWSKIKKLVRLQELEDLQPAQKAVLTHYSDIKQRLYASAAKVESLEATLNELKGTSA